MGILDQFKGQASGAKVFGRSKYFPNQGVHEVTIKRCKMSNGTKGLCYIVECEVVSSDSDELKPGDTVAQVMKLNDQYGIGLGDLKRFACEMNGIDPGADNAMDQLARAIENPKSADPVIEFAQALLGDEEEGQDLDLGATVRTWPHRTKNDKVVTRMQWEAR